MNGGIRVTPVSQGGIRVTPVNPQGVYVPPSGGGTGAVDSVNGKTGTVVLNSNDILTSSGDSIQSKLDSITISGLHFEKTTVTVTRQLVQTDEELIALYGVISIDGTPITVNQTGVDYGENGTYSVIFQTGNNSPVTVTLVIQQLFDFTAEKTKRFCTVISNPELLVDNLPISVNFSNFNVTNTSGVEPIVTPFTGGIRYEFFKAIPEAMKNFKITFSNVATLSNGDTINAELDGIDFLNYGRDKFPFNQKWGIEIYDDGNISLIQSGFLYLMHKMTFTDVTGEPLQFDIGFRFNNVNYARLIGAPITGNKEYYIKENSSILVDTIVNPDNAITNIIASIEDAGTNTDIAISMVKHSSNSFIFIWGKEYTGNINFDYATQNYLNYDINVRLGQVTGTDKPKRILLDKVGNITLINSSENITLFTIPAGTFNPNKKYEVHARFNYSRAGGTNRSVLVFKLIQGISNVIEGNISIASDTDVTLNIPQLPKTYTFNDTQTVLLNIENTSNTIPVEILDYAVSFVEVDENIRIL